MSKRWISMSKGKEGSSLKKLAAGSLTFVKAYSNGQANTAIDSLEDELERELERERKTIPTSGFARLRHKGGKILRSKHVLLLIVVLNVIDCALVLGELVLDLNHVKDILTTMEQSATTFHERLKENYPGEFEMTKIDSVYDKVINAQMYWEDSRNATNQSYGLIHRIAHNYETQTFMKTIQRYKRRSRKLYQSMQGFSSGVYKYANKRSRRSGSAQDNNSAKNIYKVEANDQSTEEVIAKIFHIFSICIVCILLTQTILKVLCFGKHFFTQKLEVFDACIVAASFIVDFVFLGGMSVYTIQEFVFILAFMLPWGVIRVVNSLVVAVRDHEHFRLKLLYTQKKKIDNDNKQLRQEKDRYNEQVDALRRLCLVEGIDEWKVQQSLSRQVRPGKGIMGSFASLALGALGGGRSNGTSIWNLLGTPKLRRGKSEEWEGKLGVNKEDTRSLRYSDRVWTVVGTSEYKKGKKQNSILHQSTVDSDPGTPTAIRGKLKALKRLLRRQDPVDATSFSSMETVDKDSKCSIDKMTSSENSSQSIDDFSADELEARVSNMPTYEIIDECSIETSRRESELSSERKDSNTTQTVDNCIVKIEIDTVETDIESPKTDNESNKIDTEALTNDSNKQTPDEAESPMDSDVADKICQNLSQESGQISNSNCKESSDTNDLERNFKHAKEVFKNSLNRSVKIYATSPPRWRQRLYISKSYNNVANIIDENCDEKLKIKRSISSYIYKYNPHNHDRSQITQHVNDQFVTSIPKTGNHTKL